MLKTLLNFLIFKIEKTLSSFDDHQDSNDLWSCSEQCETLRIDANQMELTLLHFVNIIETLQFLMQQSMAFH